MLKSDVFSGIVETTSKVLKVKGGRNGRVIVIRKPKGWTLRAGESVCVDGVCSTVESEKKRWFRVVYMPETLRRTTLGELKQDSRVNLERSLTLGSLIGGHLVQGHVDATGRVAAIRRDGNAHIYEFSLPADLSRYIAAKGSAAVDGISLTIVRAGRGRFSVSLLDYTLQRTTLGKKKVGQSVNVEVDLLAKYVERLIAR